MEVTELGILIEVRPVNAKALAPIVVNPLAGHTTEVTPPRFEADGLVFWKAFPPISVTPNGMVAVPMQFAPWFAVITASTGKLPPPEQVTVPTAAFA